MKCPFNKTQQAFTLRFKNYSTLHFCTHSSFVHFLAETLCIGLISLYGAECYILSQQSKHRQIQDEEKDHWLQRQGFGPKSHLTCLPHDRNSRDFIFCCFGITKHLCFFFGIDRQIVTHIVTVAVLVRWQWPRLYLFSTGLVMFMLSLRWTQDRSQWIWLTVTGRVGHFML